MQSRIQNRCRFPWALHECISAAFTRGRGGILQCRVAYLSSGWPQPQTGDVHFVVQPTHDVHRRALNAKISVQSNNNLCRASTKCRRKSHSSFTERRRKEHRRTRTPFHINLQIGNHSSSVARRLSMPTRSMNNILACHAVVAVDVTSRGSRGWCVLCRLVLCCPSCCANLQGHVPCSASCSPNTRFGFASSMR